VTRLAVIGAGYWGVNIVRNCADMGVLAAVCDSEQPRLNAIGRTYPGVPLYRDLEEMLARESLDGVIVAAPAPAHAELALRCIAAGKHVFVEKPLALSVADAERIVAAAELAGVRLFVGHVLLYHPAMRAMLEAINSGTIGRVRHLRSRRLSWGRLRSQENVWWSFAPHDCALMIAIMRDSPVNATGWLSAYVRPGLGDFAYADFAFADGRSAHVEVSWLDPDKSSRIDVFGSQGTLTFKDAREGATLTLTQCGDRLDANSEPELWRGPTIQLPMADGEPLRLELESFIASMNGDVAVPTDGQAGVQVVRALEMLDTRAPVYTYPLRALA
jgi:UDP-2-acetamido-3-amino-2,3-dideoxy-glucuronate N-acetyltransferase